MIHLLTPLEADEVSGLLDVCQDDIDNGDREAEPWGKLVGKTLTVVDADEAVSELRQRADWHEEESYVADQEAKGRAAARVLRRLADNIEGGTA